MSDVAVYSCNPTTQMAETGGLGLQYQPLLQDEIGAHKIVSVGFIVFSCVRVACYLPCQPLTMTITYKTFHIYIVWQ